MRSETTRSKTARSIKVKEKEAFILQIPTEFDVKPDHVVDMPRGHVAEVYKTNIANRRAFEGDPPTVPGWRILVTKNGKIVSTRTYYDGCDGVAADALDVRILLQQLSAELMPKARRTVIDEDED